jgi:hypothetical protein
MKQDFIITESQLKKIVNILKKNKKKNLKEGTDSNEMVKQQLFMIATLAYKMWEMLGDDDELEDWMVSKIAQCDASITSVVKSYMYDDISSEQKGMDILNYDDLIIGS